MKRIVALLCSMVLAMLVLAFAGRGYGGEEKRYVGSSKCKECHADIYDAFSANARKARSFSSVQRMAGQLTVEETAECYSCHTTGYNQPGGFVSLEKTPDLANLGCESCHGPGSAHIEGEGDADAILGKGKISTQKTCEACHNPARVESFGFRPVVHAGAH